jgi:hypothetical protein
MIIINDHIIFYVGLSNTGILIREENRIRPPKQSVTTVVTVISGV